MRSARLARTMLARSTPVTFLVDHDSNVNKLVPDGCGLIRLNNSYGYQLDHELDTTLQLLDATKTVSAIGKSMPSLIVIDHPCLGATWETAVKTQTECPIIAFDDTPRNHSCHIVVNYKICPRKIMLQAYRKKIDDSASLLLGPDYFLIDPPKDSSSKKSSAVGILMSFGGGGDMRQLALLVKAVIENVTVAKRKIADCRIYVVMGPTAYNCEALHEMKEYSQNLVLVEGLTSLSDLWGKVDLFVGAQGTTIFEALAHKVPCLGFSIAKNQENDISDLEEFGHYFYLGYFGNLNLTRFARLIEVCCHSLERLRGLVETRSRSLDGTGAARVMDAITAIVRDSYCPVSVSGSSRCHLEKAEGMVISSVGDIYINKYLEARNLDSNRSLMTITQEISSLDHYLWWLTQFDRENFVVTNDREEKVFIWHRFVDGIVPCLVGGWFLTECGRFFDAIWALKAQLEMCDLRYPGVPWLAVINRENKATIKLNSNLGFKEIDFDHALADLAVKLFPFASPRDFLIFVRYKDF